MKKFFSFIFAALLCGTTFAQNATKTMDKAVAAFKKSCVSASYTATGQMSDAGTFAMKGNKYRAQGKQATIWYDGKTQWTLMRGSDEVNVTTPNSKKVSGINPYGMLNLYKNGYTLSQKDTAAGTLIHMTANGNQTFKEIYVTLNSNLQPVKINFKNSKGWTYVTISNYKTTKLSDASFKFDKKQYPGVEINDLR